MTSSWYHWIQAAVAWIRAHVHFHLRKGTQAVEWSLEAALAFAPTTGDFKDMSGYIPDLILAGDEWGEVVRDATEWTEETQGLLHLEVRYIHTSAYGRRNKYRTVLRECDALTIPPGKRTHALLGPGSLLVHAQLEPWDDGSGARPVDVTGRFRKYAGPARDFHDRPLTPIQCFPFDHPDMLRERFCGVRVVTPLTSRLVGWDQNIV